jgi:Tfp pilus assembly protein PilO
LDKLKALPIWAKATILAVLLGAIGVAFQFLFIGDMEARKTGAEQRLKDFSEKRQKLRAFTEPQRRKELEEDLRKLQAQLEANRTLLPAEEEIPLLVQQVKRRADDRGLEILDIQNKSEPEAEDYLKRLPIKFKVRGQFPVLISFFNAIVDKGMRMMTIRDLLIVGIPVRDLESAKPGVGTSVDLGGDAKAKLSAAEVLIMRLDEYEDAAKNAPIEATFTVNAYSYTGALLSAADKAKKSKSRKRKR